MENKKAKREYDKLYLCKIKDIDKCIINFLKFKKKEVKNKDNDYFEK